METINKQTITIDTKKYSRIPSPKFIQQDTNILEFIIKENGNTADLSNIERIILNYKRPDGRIISKLLSVVENIIVYQIGVEEMEVSGQAEVELQFYDLTNSTRMSTSIFKITIESAIGTSEISNPEEQTLLQGLFVEIQSISAQMDEVISNALYAKEQGDYAKELVEQLGGTDIGQFANDLQGRGVTPKYYGAIGDGETNDYLSIKSILDQIKSVDLLGLEYSALNSISAAINKNNENYMVIKNGIINGKNISAVSLSNKQKMIFFNVIFKNISQLNLKNCKNISFINCGIKDTVQSGIVTTSTCSNVKIIECNISNIGIGSINETWQGMGIELRGDGHVVARNKIIRTFGHGAVYLNGAINVLVDNNDIEDTFYRGVHLYGDPSSGLVQNNRIKRTGVINTLGSGLACNGIFSAGECDASQISILNNRIKDVAENGIEGNFGLVEGNYIENTGIDYVNKPTPSTEGIWANGYIYRNNTIVNSHGTPIKFYRDEAISSLKLLENHIIGKTGETIPIDINSPNGYVDLDIIDNKYFNCSGGIKLYGASKTNVNVKGNKNISAGLSLSSFEGGCRIDSQLSGIKNQRFREWVSSVPDNWQIRNVSISKIIEDNKNIAVITPSHSTYAGGIWQDILNDYESMNIMIIAEVKGTVPLRLIIYPCNNIDGTIDYSKGTSLQFATDPENYNQYIYSATNLTHCKYRIEIGTETTDSNKNISVKSAYAYVTNNKE